MFAPTLHGFEQFRFAEFLKIFICFSGALTSARLEQSVMTSSQLEALGSVALLLELTVVYHVSQLFLFFAPWYRNRCLSHVHESTRVRARSDAFSDLQRPKTGNIMRSYRICLHNTAQFVTL